MFVWKVSYVNSVCVYRLRIKTVVSTRVLRKQNTDPSVPKPDYHREQRSGRYNWWCYITVFHVQTGAFCISNCRRLLLGYDKGQGKSLKSILLIIRWQNDNIIVIHLSIKMRITMTITITIRINFHLIVCTHLQWNLLIYLPMFPMLLVFLCVK